MENKKKRKVKKNRFPLHSELLPVIYGDGPEWDIEETPEVPFDSWDKIPDRLLLVAYEDRRECYMICDEDFDFYLSKVAIQIISPEGRLYDSKWQACCGLKKVDLKVEKEMEEWSKFMMDSENVVSSDALYDSDYDQAAWFDL